MSTPKSTSQPPATVPVFDLRLSSADLDAVSAALRAGRITPGECTRNFELAFARHLGVKHAIAVASGTAALHLAYLAATVGPGDEVIVPSYTFVATASAVRHCGATPVFADITSTADPSVDPRDVEARITLRTKAVACVHFAGYPAAVDTLSELCDAHGLVLIEDAAHAPSAELAGRKIGTWGALAAFSLFSNKVLAVGEGGVVVTDDSKLAERVRRLVRTRPDESPNHDGIAVGWSHRIDEPRSALALSRLASLEPEIARRRELTLSYRSRLCSHPGLIVPYTEESVQRSSCYAMPVFVRDDDQRDRLRVGLRDRHGVQTTVLYPPAHRFAAYRDQHRGSRLPLTEAASRSALALPLFAHMTDEQIERVLDALETELHP